MGDGRLMPVLVTAAGSDLGQAVVRKVAATGGEVRAFCGPDAPIAVLRQLGAICAAGSLLDEGHLETAMEQVHTVVHLATTPLVDVPSRIVEETATVVTAAVGANVRRLVTLSLPGARPASSDPLRRAAAEAEELVAAVPCPSTVVRVSLVDTADLRQALARTPLAGQTLANRVAPVRPDDVADLVGWLDERREPGTGDVHEVLAADGPEVVALSDYLRGVGLTPMSTPMSLVGRAVERLRPDRDGPLLAGVLAGPWTSGPELPSAWERARIAPVSPLGGAPPTSPPA
jgi:uncharacterized protein YbjT (DUF2867 family)